MKTVTFPTRLGILIEFKPPNSWQLTSANYDALVVKHLTNVVKSEKDHAFYFCALSRVNSGVRVKRKCHEG